MQEIKYNKRNGKAWYGEFKDRDPEGYLEYMRASQIRTRAKNKKERPEHYIFTTAKRRAAKYGIEFTIELSDISIPEKCPIIDIPLHYFGELRNTPSLDRIDNSKGYIKGNVAVVSYLGNSIKRDHTLETLEKIANYIKTASA